MVVNDEMSNNEKQGIYKFIERKRDIQNTKSYSIPLFPFDNNIRPKLALNPPREPHPAKTMSYNSSKKETNDIFYS